MNWNKIIVLACLLASMMAFVGCGADDSSEGGAALESEEIKDLVKQAHGENRKQALAKLREGIDSSNLSAFEDAVKAARTNVDEMKTGAKKMAMLRPGHPRNAEVSRDAAKADLRVRALETILEEKQ